MAESRPLPKPTPETAPYWEAAKNHELHIQRCDDCAHAYFPPRNFCPGCGSRNVSWFRTSGRGTLYSYTISHLPAPGFANPYAIAVVELEEGPRLMANIADCPPTPEALQLDMPLEVTFEKQTDEITLPMFRPATAATKGD